MGTEIHWEIKHIYLILYLLRGISLFWIINSHHLFSSLFRYSCKVMKIAKMYGGVNTVIAPQNKFFTKLTNNETGNIIKVTSPDYMTRNQQNHWYKDQSSGSTKVLHLIPMVSRILKWHPARSLGQWTGWILLLWLGCVT